LGPVETPGVEIVLEYSAGPPAFLRLVSFTDTNPEMTQDESGQGNKLVSLKFSLGGVLGVYGFEDTIHYYYNNYDNNYSGSYLSLIAPVLSLRLLFSLENKLRLGIGLDASYSLVMVQLTSKNGGYLTGAGYGSFYGIIGYNNIYLHAGYDFVFGALYLAPSWAINDHLLIGVPMSFFGNNENSFSIVHFMDPPDLGWVHSKSEYFQIGLSIQYVF